MWASFPDPDNIGSHQSFACAVLYRRRDEFPEEITISNFYGNMSFAMGSDGESGKYNAINTADFDSGGPWGPDSNNRTFTYATGYNSSGRVSTQVCTAGRQLFSTDRRKFKMDLKGEITYAVSSGWKLWAGEDELAPENGADGDPFEITITVLEPASAVSRVATLAFSAVLVLLYLI